MKAILLAGAVALSGAAVQSAPLKSLSEIQSIVDMGGYSQYAGTKRVNFTPKTPWLLGEAIAVGRVAPRVLNVNKLLLAASKEQVVRVAGPSDFCYPVYAELAEQNKVSCASLMGHLEVSMDNFTAATDVQMVVDSITPALEAEQVRLAKESNREPGPDSVAEPVAPVIYPSLPPVMEEEVLDFDEFLDFYEDLVDL